MMVGLPVISEYTTCGRNSYLWHMRTRPCPVRNCDRLHSAAAKDSSGMLLSDSGCSGSFSACGCWREARSSVEEERW